MKHVLCGIIIVLAVCFVCGNVLASGGAAKVQGQGSSVAASQFNASEGHGGVQGAGQLAGGVSTQSQAGYGWSQRQCSISGVGQFAVQGGGRGYKEQWQGASADTSQRQVLRSGPHGREVQAQSMNLEAGQGQSQAGRGVQVEGQGVIAVNSQGQESWRSSQSQNQTGVIIQVAGQRGGHGYQDQGQLASVTGSQFQAK